MKINPQLRKELKELFRAKIDHEKQKVTLVSAQPLSESDVELIFKHIPKLKRPTEVEYIIDKNLLGGVVVRVGSRVIDLSIQGQLQKLQNFMYVNT